ncbi:GntR family transcriptional regulator [Criibacterium bergeronii]|nr:GntR family transcriptional regulator [Criibacterium bergeronii]
MNKKIDTVTPLYFQLVDKLIELISKMEFFEKIPSERQLCDMYEVSRTTVRQALSELELNGYIIKIQGKGTFVAKPNNSKQDLSSYYSFTDQTIAMGKKPTSEILDYSVEIAKKYVQENMNLENNAKVIKFKRLRLADGVPMLLETTYLPYSKFSTLTRENLVKKPLYDIFEQDFHKKIFKVVEQYSAINLTQKQADTLKVSHNTACLSVTRYSYDAKGAIIEMTHTLARSDQFIYQTQITIPN